MRTYFEEIDHFLQDYANEDYSHLDISIHILHTIKLHNVITEDADDSDASREWLSRAIGVNEQLKGVCKDIGVSFVDDWDRVFGRRELYARDGVHLSRKGVDVLSECLERGVGMECRG